MRPVETPEETSPLRFGTAPTLREPVMSVWTGTVRVDMSSPCGHEQSVCTGTSTSYRNLPRAIDAPTAILPRYARYTACGSGIPALTSIGPDHMLHKVVLRYDTYFTVGYCSSDLCSVPRYRFLRSLDFLYYGRTVPTSCNIILFVIRYATVPCMNALVSRAQYLPNT